MRPIITGEVTLDKGLKNLNLLITSLSNNTLDWNEADTRFQFIDPFINNCLGWPRHLIKLEYHEKGKITDYELGNPRLLIIEAKKKGSYFELPANPTRKTICSLNSILKLSKNIREAVEQVQQYCSQRGVQFAVVCNGYQIITFLATRTDGQSPMDGSCLVFDGHKEIADKFPILWQMLSPEGISEKKLIRYLTKGELSGVPRKPSTLVNNYHEYRYKNDSETSLRILAELLIIDIANTAEVEDSFYSHCYCESGALSQYSLISKNIIKSRYSSLFPKKEPGPSVEPIKKSKKDIELNPSVIADALSKRPLVLIGDVGVGKTSFLKNLILKTAKSEFENSIYIYIDLGSKAALRNELNEFIIDEIDKQLFNRYNIDIKKENFVKGVYNSDIERFRNGIYASLYKTETAEYEKALLEFLEEKIKDKPQHLSSSIHHIVKGQNKPLVLILDNADQRDINIQQQSFIVSQSFASETDAIVFIAVRPQTFYRSKRSGVISAYPPKIFTIAPPRVDLVLKKRLDFTLKMSEGKIPVPTLDEVKLNLSDLCYFIKALLYSLEYNKDLIELLSNITGGNIRDVIELVKNFIGNPNVESDKIIRIMKEDDQYLIPVHEFSKSAILGEYSHYSDLSSIAMNIYDVMFPDTREHFLVSIILGYLDYNESHRDRDGFVNIDKIYLEFQNAGFTIDQIDSALRRLTNKKLIETSERISYDEDYVEIFDDKPHAFRITTIGAYHLKIWSGSFSYLDAMLFETPIFKENVMNSLAELVNSIKIQGRYDRNLIFKSYLKSIWNECEINVPYYDFTELLKNGDKTFKSVKSFIDRLPYL